MAVSEHYVEAIAHKLNLDIDHVREVGWKYRRLTRNC